MWQDPWPPRSWSRRQIIVRGQKVISKVSELLDPTTGTWDVALVCDTFCDQDASTILALTMYEDMEYDWAWHLIKKEFSVSSLHISYRDS
jgi:hypothetical protein